MGDGVAGFRESFDDLPIHRDSKPLSVGVFLFIPCVGSSDRYVVPDAIDRYASRAGGDSIDFLQE